MKKLRSHCIDLIFFLSIIIQLINCESSSSSTNELSTVEKSNDIVIKRVDLPDEKKEKLFSIAHLNDTHENLSVKWLGKGSSVMIILAKNNKAKTNASRSTNLYISYDYGETFKLEDRLKLEDGSPAILHTFITSKVNSSTFLFTDIVNNYLFISDDHGLNFFTKKMNFTPKNLQMHPTYAYNIIASDDTDNTSLYWSEDFGRDWKWLRGGVYKFSWATFENQNRIYAIISQMSGKKGFEYSDDYFANAQFLRNNVKDFKVCGNYVIYIAYNSNIGGPEKDQYTTMFVSHNNSSFNMALTNNKTRLDSITDFQVVDCAESELIIAANFNNSKTHLFISDRKGNRLRKVLDNVVVSNNKTDVHKVAGLTNIYIANAYVGKSNTTIQSLITYDSGYSWKRINLSQVQSDELTNFKCTSETCSLHFLQNSITHQLKYPGIITKESAVGIIVANGVIDEYLKNDTKVKQVPQTYISRDAGEHWRKVADGKYLFNIADHGGLIVGVKHFSKSTATKTLIYSMDDGKTFKELQFINESMKVYSLLTENGEKTSIFTIFGSMDNAPHSWTLVKVNLTSLYARKCDEMNDFEFWRPHANANSPCIMGLKMKLHRRKEDANCSYGDDYERQTKPELCTCTRDDYVCDFGFIEHENRSCSPVDLEEFLPECDPKENTRTILGGYMKIPGNQCLPPKDSPYENSLFISCSSKSTRDVFKTIFLSLLLTIIAFCAGYFGINYFRTRQVRSTLLNTHYNRRTDSAILLDDDGLGEEVHVRGFSDDVPMVIS